MHRSEAVRTTTTLLESAVATRLFPAAVAEVGSSRGVEWSDAFGTLTFDADTSPAALDTIFDLASITKALSTTTLVLDQLATGLLALDEPVARSFPEWLGAGRADATLQDLLEHCSGLPARLLDPPPSTRREFEHDICTMPLEYPLRQRSIYSDLDFILLGFLIADRGRQSLESLFDDLRLRLTAGVDDATDVLTFRVSPSQQPRTAPTVPLPEDLRAPRRLAGEVHDNYAAALGGVAGHAGLFGTASGVGRVARLALRGARGDAFTPSPFTPPAMRLARRRSTVPRSSRALGWDTMLPTSSCGTRMSSGAFGHVGFTGTSLWIDPDRDRYFVLLTNRVCGGGTSDQMQVVRRAFHDAFADF